jgi:hypothetical protein
MMRLDTCVLGWNMRNPDETSRARPLPTEAGAGRWKWAVAAVAFAGCLAFAAAVLGASTTPLESNPSNHVAEPVLASLLAAGALVTLWSPRRWLA